MNLKAIQLLISLVCILLVVQAPKRDEIGNKNPLSDPHDHVVDVNMTNWLFEQNAADFQIVEVNDDLLVDIVHDEVINSKASMRAFTNCDDDCRIFVVDEVESEVYELIAPSFFTTRPFTGLDWVTDDVLVFDQWSQPHHGVHYTVKVMDRMLLLVSPFPDKD